MGRPLKDSLDYFQHDVNMSSDEKVEALETAHGNDGYAVYCKILERIYKSCGRLDLSDDVQKLAVVKRCNVSASDFDKIVTDSVRFGLFEREPWESDKRLTSKRIREQIALVEEIREKKRARKTPAGVMDVHNPSYSFHNPSYGQEEVHRAEQSRVEESRAEQEGGALFAFALKKAIEKGARSPEAMARKLVKEPDVIAEWEALKPKPPRNDALPEPPLCTCGGEIKADRWGGDGRCLGCGSWWRWDRLSGAWAMDNEEF